MVKRRGYTPDRGDAVWITLDPQAGHELGGIHAFKINGYTGLPAKLKHPGVTRC
jgi:hypothetical protein